MAVSKVVKRMPREAAAGAWREPGLLARLGAAVGTDTGKLIDSLVERLQAAEETVAAQRQRIADLESLSITDELTGLLNRRGFQRELDRALERAKRRQETGLLLLGDIDGFKTINDRFGHGIGDAALEAAATALARGIRRNDAAARIGGDEFAVLVADTSPMRSGPIADKLERLVAAAKLPPELAEHGLAISFGAVAYGAGAEATGLMQAADHALYRRKRARRAERRS